MIEVARIPCCIVRSATVTVPAESDVTFDLDSCETEADPQFVFLQSSVEGVTWQPWNASGQTGGAVRTLRPFDFTTEYLYFGSGRQLVSVLLTNGTAYEAKIDIVYGRATAALANRFMAEAVLTSNDSGQPCVDFRLAVHWAGTRNDYLAPRAGHFPLEAPPLIANVPWDAAVVAGVDIPRADNYALQRSIIFLAGDGTFGLTTGWTVRVRKMFLTTDDSVPTIANVVDLAGATDPTYVVTGYGVAGLVADRGIWKGGQILTDPLNP